MEKSQPRPRAVFSPNDFELIKKALAVYNHNYGNSLQKDEQAAIASLMHRLGRIDNGS